MPQERDTRRLSAILAADVVGYSRLTAADERGTLTRFRAHRMELIEPTIATHNGRLVKTTGDGFLVEFASVVDAVECAVEWQRRMALRNRDLAADKRIDFRIGINLGDVVAEGDDILGDGVNIAARLEGIAEPGGIVISRSAREQVRDKVPYAMDDLGEIEVKNIPRPVRAFRVRIEGELAAAAPVKPVPAPKRKAAWQMPAMAAGLAVALIGAGLALWRPWTTPAPAPAVVQGQSPVQTAATPAARSPALPQLPASITGPIPAERAQLIVLPFANLSGDPQQEYFSDGITEDITTALARIPGFLVMARNTAFTFRGKPVNAQSVGRDLGVRYLLEGSVQKSGDRLRLNAQLIETATGNHVWAERFDRPLADVFIIQDELSDRVVGTVAAQLRRREGERSLAASPEMLEAYGLTMRARLLRTLAGRDNIFEARRLLLSAINRDSSFALAHVELAMALTSINANRWNEEYASPATVRQMMEEATRAVTLAPGDAMAWAVHAEASTSMGQFDTALADVDRAIAMSPGDPSVLAIALMTINRLGRHEQTIEMTRKVFSLDPFLSPTVLNSAGLAFYALGRNAEAIEATRYCVQRAPTQVLCRVYYTAMLATADDLTQARSSALELVRLSPGYSIAEEARRLRIAFRDPTISERIADGLRKAGVPE